MKFLTIFFIIFFNIFQGQTKNLKNYNQIIFSTTDSITNEKTHVESLKKIMGAFESTLGNLADSLNVKKPETIKLDDSLFQEILKEENKKTLFHFKKVNDSIFKRFTTDEKMNEQTSPIFLNIRNGNEYYHFPNINNDRYKFQFENIKNLKVNEYKKEIRKIKGIKCFKIIVEYQEGFKNEDSNEIMDEYFHKIDVKETLWVTYEIKSLFHPIYKIKEVLEKYYPLEIYRETNISEGSIQLQKIETIN